MLSAQAPVKTWAELLAYSKANAGKLNHGSPSASGTQLAEVLKARTGLSFTNIPYPGSGPIFAGMLSGEISFVVGAPAGWSPHYNSGAVRPLFFISAKRLPALPNVPTNAELGIQSMTVGTALGLWAPRDTPRAIIQKLNEAGVASVRAPEIADKLRSEQILAEPMGSTPEEQIRIHQEELKVFTEGARLANSKP